MRITSLDSEIIIAENFEQSLSQIITKQFTEANNIFFIVDENTRKHCLPLIDFQHFKTNESQPQIIEIQSGEENKTIDTCKTIWNFLSMHGANRNSLIINLGGGVICDMGGFAAATFKRGINFVNIPTTLLAQVDASAGGKLAVNFNGLKNEIGLFRTPKYVLIDTLFLKTLSTTNMLSGFGEIIKHALIYGISYWETVKKFDILNPDYKKLVQLISKSIFIKSDFVKNDPKEKNIRKSLNFGHTAGHAFETLLNHNGQQRISHGAAVAHGMIVELYLSHIKNFFKIDKLNEISEYILDIYGKIGVKKVNYQQLYDLMLHDKKRDNQNINFTLLEDIGEVTINQNCTKEQVLKALEFHAAFQTNEKEQ